MGKAPGSMPCAQGKKNKQKQRQKKSGCPAKDGVGANNEDEVMAWGDVGDDSPSVWGGAAETKARQNCRWGKEFMTGGEARGTVCEHGGGMEREVSEGR